MHRVLAIALNTFREAVRDRVLYGVVAFAVLVLLFTLALAELSLDQQARVVYDVGVASISLFAVVIAVFLGSSLLYKEIERKTLYVILPKPIERWEFLVGKYLGIVLTGGVFVLLMGAVQCWTSAVQADVRPSVLIGSVLGSAAVFGGLLAKTRDPSAMLMPFSVVAFGLAAGAAGTTPATLEPLFAQLALTTTELCVVAAVAIFFSSFSTPFLTGILTFGVFLISRSADALVRMPGRTLSDEVKQVLRVIAWFVPNGHLFFPGRSALMGQISAYGTTLRYVGETVGYGALYATITLMLASMVFAKRDFT